MIEEVFIYKPDWVIAYAAGLFDGEGCVRVEKEPKYALRVSFGMTERGPLDLLSKYWGTKVGGPVWIRDTPLRKNTRPIYSWGVSGRRAFGFLQDVEPYCIAKTKQIELALQYPFLRAGYAQLSETATLLRASLHLQLHEAKHTW